MIRGKAASKRWWICSSAIAASPLMFARFCVCYGECRNNHNLDVDKLVVAEAYVGKAVKMKRFSARARGRSPD